MGKWSCLGLLVAAVSSPARAANIYIETSGEDLVGKRFSYELRERIAGSSRHELVDTEEDAAFIVQIVTLDSGNRVQTVYSVSLLLENFGNPTSFHYFITSWAGRCGSNITSKCAADLAAEMDAEMQPITRGLLDGLRQQTNKQPERF